MAQDLEDEVEIGSRLFGELSVDNEVEMTQLWLYVSIIKQDSRGQWTYQSRRDAISWSSSNVCHVDCRDCRDCRDWNRSEARRKLSGITSTRATSTRKLEQCRGPDIF